MTEAYCLDCLEILLKTDVTPDRSPKTCTVARYNCISVLEDIDRKSLLLCSNLLLEVRCAVNFAIFDVKLTYFLTLEVYEDS